MKLLCAPGIKRFFSEFLKQEKKKQKKIDILVREGLTKKILEPQRKKVIIGK